jgi:hypothetical protein
MYEANQIMNQIMIIRSVIRVGPEILIVFIEVKFNKV